MNLSEAGFKNGCITLDDPQPIYYSAQTISGKVEFQLNEPLSFTAINVVYRGEANVSWTERQTEMYSGVKRYKNVEYKGYEEYFNFVQCICGGNGTSVLTVGPHSIPFSYQIPHTAPSSFESSIGSVSYKITAYLECPPVMREELVKAFEVVAPLDLNMDPTGDVKRPIEMEFEEVYSCCFSSQPIAVGVKLPVSGYCPGQFIPITVDVKNDSSTEISKMYFHLVMKERYHSRSPVSEYVLPEKILATSKRGAVMGKTRRQYQCDLPVPEMLAPNLTNCGIIDVGYFFKVTIKLSGCNDDLQEESELYIGLIPLEITTGGSAYVHPLKHRLPRGPPPLGPPLPTPYGSRNDIRISNAHPETSTPHPTNPYSVQNHISPLATQGANQQPPYPTPSAPYPASDEPAPYVIGFKV